MPKKMMTKKHYFYCLMIAAVSVLLIPHAALASDALTSFLDMFGDEGDVNRGISSAVVAAVRTALTGSLMMSLFENLRDEIEAGISATMMLAVIIFGVRVVTNDFRHHVELRSQMFVLAIKLALIGMFLYEMQSIMQQLLLIPEQLIEIVMGVVDFSSTVGCGLGAAPATIPGPPAVSELWWKIDCLFLNSFGISMAGAGASAVLGMTISAGASGLLGSYITYTGIAAFIGILFTIMRVTYSYVASMIIIIFLLSLAPLFLPMILFQITKTFFDKWLNLIVGFILQPMLVAVGLMFTILMFNTVLFTSENSLVNTLFPGVLGQNVDASNWRELNDILYERTIDSNAIASVSDAEQCDEETNTDHIVEAGNERTATLRFGCNNGLDMTSLGPVSLIAPIMQQTVNFTSEQFGFIQDGGGTGDPVQDAVLALEGMKDLILSFASVLLVTFAAHALMEQMDTLGKRLTNFSFRLDIPFDVPFESQFKGGLSVAQNVTNRQLKAGVPLAGLAPGLAAEDPNVVPSAYRAGAAAATGTMPFVGDAAAGVWYQAELDEYNSKIDEAERILSNLSASPAERQCAAQLLAEAGHGLQAIVAETSGRSSDGQTSYSGVGAARDSLGGINELIADDPMLQSAYQQERNRLAEGGEPGQAPAATPQDGQNTATTATADAQIQDDDGASTVQPDNDSQNRLTE